MYSITNAEILSLISEVGQPLLLRTFAEPTSANLTYGIPATSQSIDRAIRGYVVPEKARWVAAEAQSISSGNWTAYVAGSDLTQADITPGVEIIWDGRNYAVEYLQGIYQRTRIMLHKLRLVQTQATN